MNVDLQNSKGFVAKHLPDGGDFSKEINAAGMAELVDARDLKSPATTEIAQTSCKTSDLATRETGSDPVDLQNISASESQQSWLPNPTLLKQHMRILRKKFGATSKIGRRCSNVEEALINLPGAGDFQRTNLEKSIKRWLTELNGLLTPA